MRRSLALFAKGAVLKNISISVSAAFIVMVISYLLFRGMDNSTPLIVSIICINFGIVAGFLTFDILWAKKNKIKSLQGSIKAGLIVGITVFITGFDSFLGIESIDESIVNGKILLKLLVLSTGYVGFTLGGLTKYLLFEESSIKKQ